MKKHIVLFLLCTLFLFSCAHYTEQEGLKRIQPEAPSTTVTNYTILTREPEVPVDKDKVITTLQTENTSLKNENTTLKALNTNLAADAKEVSNLRTENASLTDENAALKTQNEQLSTTTGDQASRIAFYESRIATMTNDLVTLQARLASYTSKETKEKEAQTQAQAERATLPPLASLSYPKVYRTGTTLQSGITDRINVLLIPLGQVSYSENEISEIAGSVADINAQILLVTGSKENVYLLAKTINRSAVFTEMGAVISDYELSGDPDAWGVRLKIDSQRTVRLAVAEMPEYTVFKTFLAGGDWKASVNADKEKRLSTIKDLLSKDSPSEASVVGASLYEPATSDWSTLSPVDYRRLDYSWPLADAVLNGGYLDTYRQTHFSEATDAGDTLIEQTLKERTDYLFAKRVLPLSSSVITLGPASVEKDGYARMGVLASYLIP
jgi:regulator of replication initiation timing